MILKIIIVVLLFSLYDVSTVRALTLDDAVNAALKNNPTISVAHDLKSSQKYKKYSAYVSRIGEVAFIGNITRYNLERTLTPMVPPISPPFPLADDTITNIGVSYTLPLFTSFKLSSNISIASLNYEIAKAQSSLTEKQIKFKVYSLFLKGLSLKEQLKAKIEQEKALAELKRNVELGVKIGRYAAIDLKKVSYQYEMVKAQRQSMENNIFSLKAEMNQFTGIETDEWDFEPAELKGKDYPPLAELEKYAMLNREEVTISVKKKQVAAANYSKAKYSYLPDIYANYTYFRSIGGGGSVPLWNYGVVVQWSVFDFGRRAFDMMSQKQEYKSAEEGETAVQLSVRREVVEAYNSLQSQLAMHEAAVNALSYAKDAMEVENIKYQQNAGSMYDLLLSIAQYYDAVSQERSAYYGMLTVGKYLELVAGEDI